MNRQFAKLLYLFGLWGWLMTLVAFIFVARHAGVSPWLWTFPLWGPPLAYVVWQLMAFVVAVLLRPWL